MTDYAKRKSKEEELLALLEEEEKFNQFNQIDLYRPTEKQAEFHRMGRDHRQRLLMAGNQTGKTYGAGCEITYHMTGEYPDWWQGYRFTRPINLWAAGVTARSTRLNPQRILLGRGRNWGTGTVRKRDLIGEPLMARGEPDLVDSFQVQHKTGGVSTCWFLNYQQGREKWQGETLDLIWCDEEPPYDIYSEAITRLNRRKGLMLITFTPLLGMTEVVRLFLRPAADDIGARQRAVTKMTLEDATFYTKKEMQEIVGQYGEFERDARTKGIPMLGSGLVYPVPDEDLMIEPFKLPDYYARIVGIDLGIDHPNAGCWVAHDRDTDTVYIYDIYKKRDQRLSEFADAVKSRGDWVPVSWPHDALKRDPRSGEVFAEMLRRRYKLETLGMSARWDEDRGGPQSRERATAECLERMQTGRLKVFKTCREWFDEKASYHRKDGLIVDFNDDLMSAMHYAIMMLRYARTNTRMAMPQRATDLDFDPLSSYS